MKVIPVAAYAMNICRFNVSEMKQLKTKDGEPKTTRQRNSKTNYTKNKKTNVISGWAKILNHDDARTDDGDKIVESSERIGARRTL